VPFSVTEDDSFAATDADVEGDDEKLLKQSPRRRGKLGCWANCGQMCCNRAIISQKELLQLYIAETSFGFNTTVELKE